MEYEKIQQLMKDMGESKLTSIDIDFPDGTKISMKKEMENTNLLQSVQTVQTIQAIPTQQMSLDTLDNSMSNDVQAKDTIGNIVKSPMVGTFYIKSSPTSDPYVELGNTVSVGDTLCIIEAMKLMNEIESEYSGKVLEVLVNDGQMVEYGTPLFRIG